jgi:hypothetical protein
VPEQRRDAGFRWGQVGSASLISLGGCQDFCVNGVDLVIGAGSSAVNDVPVLTAVKPWSVSAIGWAG